MIDEVAEVKQYLAGKSPEEKKRLYRACYMIAKYLKEDGMSPVDAVSFIDKWLSDSGHGKINLLQCVNAAYMNENKLKHGRHVYISDDDVQAIIKHAPMDTDRRVALALLCNAKAFADKKGVFQASTEAIASWLGMNGANIRNRSIRRLCGWGYIDKIDTYKGKAAGRFSKYSRFASCFKLLVPWKNTNGVELINNDIDSLYSALFKE